MLCFKPTVPTASFPTNPVLTPSSAPPSKVLVGWYSYDSLSPEGPTKTLKLLGRPVIFRLSVAFNATPIKFYAPLRPSRLFPAKYPTL